MNENADRVTWTVWTIHYTQHYTLHTRFTVAIFGPFGPKSLIFGPFRPSLGPGSLAFGPLHNLGPFPIILCLFTYFWTLLNISEYFPIGPFFLAFLGPFKKIFWPSPQKPTATLIVWYFKAIFSKSEYFHFLSKQLAEQKGWGCWQLSNTFF